MDGLPIYLLFIVNALHLASSRNASLATQQRLKKHLFADSPYDPTLRPTRIERDELEVSIHLNLIRLDKFDEHSQTATLHAGAVIRWHDFQLMWNNTEYDHLNELLLNRFDGIWRPDLTILYGGKIRRVGTASDAVEILYDGSVTWFAVQDFNFVCRPDSFGKNAENEDRSCTIVFSSIGHHGQLLNLTTAGIHVPATIDKYTGNSVWHIGEVTSKRDLIVKSPLSLTKPVMTIRFDVALQRRSPIDPRVKPGSISKHRSPIVSALLVVSWLIFFLPRPDRWAIASSTIIGFTILGATNPPSAPSCTFAVWLEAIALLAIVLCDYLAKRQDSSTLPVPHAIYSLALIAGRFVGIGPDSDFLRVPLPDHESLAASVGSNDDAAMPTSISTPHNGALSMDDGERTGSSSAAVGGKSPGEGDWTLVANVIFRISLGMYVTLTAIFLMIF